MDISGIKRHKQVFGFVVIGVGMWSRDVYRYRG